jgi:hypothetical protein
VSHAVSARRAQAKADRGAALHAATESLPRLQRTVSTLYHWHDVPSAATA